MGFMSPEKGSLRNMGSVSPGADVFTDMQFMSPKAGGWGNKEVMSLETRILGGT